MKIRYVVVLVMICFFIQEAEAQKGYELGGWIGTSFYYGDLNNRLAIQKPGIAGGLNYRRNFNTRISFMGSMSYGRIAADDADSPNNFEQNRNLSFASTLFDLSGVMEFNFFDYIHGSTDEYYTPYIFGGLSAFRYNPTAELNGQRYNLRNFGTEGQFTGEEYGNFSGSVIIGGGWKWDITDDWSLNAHIRYHKVFTDYLDDVSRTYPDQGFLRDLRGDLASQLSDRSLVEGLGDAGRQRGNSKDNDAFFFVGISLMRYFGNLECPKISNQ
jgi:hypothetical protein